MDRWERIFQREREREQCVQTRRRVEVRGGFEKKQMV